MFGEEMAKRFPLLLIGLVFYALGAGAAPIAPASTTYAASGGGASGGGIKIRKASAGEEKKQDTMEAATGTNLVGTAIGLFQGFKALSENTKALSDACIISGDELTYINKMVREYAKTGKQTADEMMVALSPTKTACGGGNSFISTATLGNESSVCYKGVADEGIAKGYPVAEAGRECPPDKPGCNKTKDGKNYSNGYKIYEAMGWSDADLLGDELSLHAKLKEKIPRCDEDALKRQQKELTGQFITSTIGGIGQKQNTGQVMDQVGGLMQGMGAGGSPLTGIGQMGMGILPGLMQ
jgi:hypothetical protein